MILPAKPPVARLPVSSHIDTGKPKPMNDLQNKSQLRREQNAVLDEVKQCLTNKTSCGSRAIGYLIFEHLKSDPTWAYPERWLDALSTFGESVIDSQTVQVIGYLDWMDQRPRVGGDDLFDATFQLVQTPEGEALDYTIRFCAEGIVRQITPTEFDWALVDDPDAFLPDLDQLFLFLVKSADCERDAVLSEFWRTQNREWRQELRIVAAELLGKAGEQGRQRLLAALELPDPVLHCLVLFAFERLIEKAGFLPPLVERLFTGSTEEVGMLAAAIHFKSNQQLPEELCTVEFVRRFFALQESCAEPLATNASLTFSVLPCVQWFVQQNQELADFVWETLEKDSDRFWIFLPFLENCTHFNELQRGVLAKVYRENINREGRKLGQLLWKTGDIDCRSIILDGLIECDEKLHHQSVKVLELSLHQPSDVPLLISGFHRARAKGVNAFSFIRVLARVHPRDVRIADLLEKIAPGLWKRLDHPDLRYQAEGFETFSIIGGNAETVVPVLMNKLENTITKMKTPGYVYSSQEGVFVRILLKSLARYGEEARKAVPLFKTLCCGLRYDPGFYGHKALSLLAELGSDGAWGLLLWAKEIISDEDYPYRIQHALSKKGATFVPQLIEAMNIPELQPMVVQTLSAIGPEAKAAIPILLHAFHHQNTCGRTALADCFGCIGSGDPAVIAALSSVTRDADLELRLMAIDALRRIGKPATEVLRDLIECPPTEAPDLTLCWALNALSECGDESHETRALCQNRLSHPSAGVRFFARCVLGKMSCPDPAGNVSVR